jgi:hypothetical protein
MEQGDQIGRLFAHWVTHYFGNVGGTYRNSTNNRATFSAVKVVHEFSPQNGLGYILGDIFTNASGHPGI